MKKLPEPAFLSFPLPPRQREERYEKSMGMALSHASERQYPCQKKDGHLSLQEEALFKQAPIIFGSRKK